MPLAEILDHEHVGGEIADENRRCLKIVLDDLIARIEREVEIAVRLVLDEKGRETAIRFTRTTIRRRQPRRAGGMTMLRASTAIIGLAAAAVFGLTVGACTKLDTAPTAAPPPAAVIETPSPSPLPPTEPLAAPTATSEPTVSPASTPTVTPTPTPTFTPAPTPTPTLRRRQEELGSQFGWYTNPSLSDSVKQQLSSSLLQMSHNYPLVFEAVAAEEWIDPDEIGDEMRLQIQLLGRLWSLLDLLQNEEIIIRVIDMPFLDTLGGDEWRIISDLRQLAEIDAEALSRLVGNLEAEGGIVDNLESEELMNAFLYAKDGEAARRILERRFDKEWLRYEVSLSLRSLYLEYPDVFWAFTDNFGDSYIWTGEVPGRVRSLAKIDADVAARVAAMPFSGDFAGSATLIWRMLPTTVRSNPEALHEILDKYDADGGIKFADQPYVLMDLMGIYDATIKERLDTFDWVQDGINVDVLYRVPEEQYFESPFVEPSWESEAISCLAEAVREGNTEVVHKLLSMSWLEDTLPYEKLAATRTLVYALEPEISLVLLEMQFLEEFMEGDERALFDIGSFLNQFQDRRDEALEELLSHNRIDGEITDSNLQYLDLAIQDSSEQLRG